MHFRETILFYQTYFFLLSVTAVELLVALHTIDLSQIELKFVVKAASLCLSESDVYTHEQLAVVLQVSLIYKVLSYF